jgi:hypothetical protein
VLVIKAKAGSPADLAKLRVPVNQKASGLLEEHSDRVLVVYGKQAASLYYEGAQGSARAPRVG